MLWIGVSAILMVLIILLLAWIYYTGGGTLRTKELTDRIKELKRENSDIKETNEILRSSLDSSETGISQPVLKASNLIQDLISVREALKGSTTAKDNLEKRYNEEIGPGLIQDILSSKREIGTPLKRRLAHEIIVGNIGRDILKDLDEGESIKDASANAGIPLRIGKEKVRLLKKAGYLDNKLDLTDWGREILEL